MATGIERRTVIGWTLEPDERAPIRASAEAESFAATSAGSTTTTISTLLTGANAASYVGNILRCVGGTAANVGVDVLVTEFNSGTDTLTHTAFPSGTADNDQFALYVPPDPICVETTGGGTTAVVASARNEADYTPRAGSALDYWGTGDYLVARAADNNAAGTARAVSAFVAASGTFTNTAFSATVIGDLYYLRRFPKFWGPPTFTWKAEDIEHVSQRNNFSKDQSIQGPLPWSAEVTLPLKGSGTAAGDAVVAVQPPELALPMRALFDVTTSLGNTLGAGSTTTVLQVSNGTEARHPVGSMLLTNDGRLAVVTATAPDGANPDDITVTPTLNAAPNSGELIYGACTYEPKTTGHLTMTLDAFIGGVTNVTGYGGLITSCKIVDFKRGAVPKMVLGFQGGYFLETSFALPSGLAPTYDAVRPVDAKDVHVILGASTRLILKEATVDFGLVAATEDAFSLPGAIYGGRIVDMKPTISVTAYLDTTSPNDTFAEIQRYRGGQTFTLMLQHGKARGNVVGVYAHKCAWMAPDHGVTDGLRTVSFTAEVLASDLTLMPDILWGVA